MKNAIGSSLLSLLIALGTDPAGATAPCKNHYILTDPDPCALSMPGTLDPTFGGSGFALFGGEVVQPFWAYAIAMQPDGKSVVAGGQPATAGAIVNRTVLARFLPDGSLDPGFGAGGIALTPSAHDVGVASEVIVQADLKILVAGAPYTDGISRTTQRFALARYHPDGTLDTDFGNGGSVFTAIGHSSDLRRLLVRADGTILAAGSICAARSCEGALARYTASGKPDLAFGDGGVVVFGDAGPITIGLQTDGKFVASLPNLRPDEKYDPYVTGRLIRVDAEGKLDVDFGQGGTIFTHFVAGAILVDATGRIVIAGATRIADPDHARLTLARYHSNGAPDLRDQQFEAPLHDQRDAIRIAYGERLDRRGRGFLRAGVS